MDKLIQIIRPEFFDIFGVFVFLFIIWIAYNSLTKKEPLAKWMAIILLLIGLAGFIVDGVIVFLTYIK